MRLLVGLGNPGAQYQSTRHNVGWMALDRLAEARGARFRTDRRFRADVAEITLAESGERVLLVKPLTYMNLSGEAVGAVARFYKIEPQDVLVITDDFDLPLGRIRVRSDGSAGTHNGMRSLVAHLGTGFPRVRIGVGAPRGEAIDHVLGAFRQEERDVVDEATTLATDAALMVFREGASAAMNRYNPKPRPAPRPKPPLPAEPVEREEPGEPAASSGG